MKFKSLILAALFTTFAIGAAHAGNNWLGVQAGAGIPTGDYGDAASNGWNFGATGTHMINSQWGVGGDLGYHAWNGSDDLNAAMELAFGPGSEIRWTAFQASAHAVAMFPSNGNMTPYAKFGLGIYNVSSKLDSPSGNDSVSESKVGFNLGGGMNWAAQNNMRWGVGASYHVIPAEDEFGSNLNFLSMGVNVMWGVGQ